MERRRAAEWSEGFWNAHHSSHVVIQAIVMVTCDELPESQWETTVQAEWDEPQQAEAIDSMIASLLQVEEPQHVYWGESQAWLNGTTLGEWK